MTFVERITAAVAALEGKRSADAAALAQATADLAAAKGAEAQAVSDRDAALAAEKVAVDAQAALVAEVGDVAGLNASLDSLEALAAKP